MATGQNTQSLTPEQAAAITNEYIRRVSDHTARAFSVFRRLAAKKRMTFNLPGIRDVLRRRRPGHDYPA